MEQKQFVFKGEDNKTADKVFECLSWDTWFNRHYSDAELEEEFNKVLSDNCEKIVTKMLLIATERCRIKKAKNIVNTFVNKVNNKNNINNKK